MASAAFTVEGVAYTVAVSVAASSTVDLALVSVTGVDTVEWSITASSDSALSNPTITPAGSPSGQTASFTMTSTGAFMVRCKVNPGRDDEAEARGIVGVLDAQGRIPLVVGEVLERHSTHGWTMVLNSLSSAPIVAGTYTGQPITWNGTTWAANTGNIVLPNNQAIFFEASPAGDDVRAVAVNASEELFIGYSGTNGAVNAIYDVKTSGVHQFKVNNVVVAEAGATYLSVGATADTATAGTIRLPNATGLWWKSATSGNIRGIHVDASDQLLIGLNGAGGPVNIIYNVDPSGVHQFKVDDVEVAKFDSSGNLTAANFKRGTGLPEGAVVGTRGDIFMRTDGGASTTMYIKETGDATNTGWRAV